ncbi:MAG: hypothetical protein RIB61_17970 [Roseicyclus sp.]|jgi:hypothetical protein
MTRVAVVGTSNIGAIKYALPEIAQDWPGFDVTCYGLPGGKFDAAAVDDAGVFRPSSGDAATLKLARRVNGTEALDLKSFDTVLVIGDTLGMPATLYTALNYDVVSWATRRNRPLISAHGFLSAMEEAIAERTAHLAGQFRDIRPVFVAPAPYPTTAVVPQGALQQQPYAAMAAHPEAARLQQLFRAALARALETHAIGLVLQPDHTIARPFLTKPEFGISAMDFRAEGQILDDHRHMNAQFGASLFRAFALALSATPAGSHDLATRKDQGA